MVVPSTGSSAGLGFNGRERSHLKLGQINVSLCREAVKKAPGPQGSCGRTKHTGPTSRSIADIPESQPSSN